MPSTDYELVDVLKDGDVRSKITKRPRPNLRTQYTYRIYKVYERDGQEHESPWLDNRHVDSHARLLVKTRDVIEREQERERAELIG